jgi:prepilin-type processing-associated H-X9-DG protein
MKNYNLFWCPSFNEGLFAKGMDQKDCDGNGTAGSGSTGWIPPLSTAPNLGGGNGYVAKMGIAFALSGGDGLTPQTAWYNFPGSGWIIDGSGNYVMGQTTFAQIVNPARTTNMGDGVTLVLSDGSNLIGTTFGCESRYLHKGGSGSNMAFMDGHSKFIIGNTQDYITNDNGFYYWTYLTLDH